MGLKMKKNKKTNFKKNELYRWAFRGSKKND